MNPMASTRPGLKGVGQFDGAKNRSFATLIYESFVKLAVIFVRSTPRMFVSKPIPSRPSSAPVVIGLIYSPSKRQRFISQRYRNQDTDLKRSM